MQVEKNTTLTIAGADKVKIGDFAATVRRQREPEPYKVCLRAGWGHGQVHRRCSWLVVEAVRALGKGGGGTCSSPCECLPCAHQQHSKPSMHDHQGAQPSAVCCFSPDTQGKGIRYQGEVIKLKEGKAGGKKK